MLTCLFSVKKESLQSHIFDSLSSNVSVFLGLESLHSSLTTESHFFNFSICFLLVYYPNDYAIQEKPSRVTKVSVSFLHTLLFVLLSLFFFVGCCDGFFCVLGFTLINTSFYKYSFLSEL